MTLHPTPAAPLLPPIGIDTFSVNMSRQDLLSRTQMEAGEVEGVRGGVTGGKLAGEEVPLMVAS